VTVAVLDSGISQHDDLPARRRRVPRFVNGRTRYDDYGPASRASLPERQGLGGQMAGRRRREALHQGTRQPPPRVGVIAALDWLADHALLRRPVANISAPSQPTTRLGSLAHRAGARQKGIVVVAAAGNSEVNGPEVWGGIRRRPIRRGSSPSAPRARWNADAQRRHDGELQLAGPSAHR
jgi:hypothetical protein